MKVLEQFSDIHSHTRRGHDIITNLEEGQDITTAPGEAWYSAGIHPWDSEKEPDWDWLEKTVEDSRVVAVGEAGLDRLRGADLERQIEIFRRQALLAEKVNKPLIIHCVRCWAELLKLHNDIKPESKWIIHGFRGKEALARQLINAGMDISLGLKAPEELTGIIPSDRLHRETDALSPDTY